MCIHLHILHSVLAVAAFVDKTLHSMNGATYTCSMQLCHQSMSAAVHCEGCYLKHLQWAL